MKKSTFEIPKMDCPSEENLIRMKLDGFEGIKNLDFDLQGRKLNVYHEGEVKEIEASILDLNLGGRLTGTEASELSEIEDPKAQRKLLWIVLAINFVFFLLEMTFGLLSGSMGLIADSLDMLADSLVYAISLFAVGAALTRKKKVARLAGYFQLSLAVLGFAEVLRRFLGEEALPDFMTMIIVSLLALSANALCLYLLQKSKSKEAHMQASMIFTSNDIIINTGVILAALFVNWFESSWPDLIIGAIVFLLVIQGALRILKLGR